MTGCFALVSALGFLAGKAAGDEASALPPELEDELRALESVSWQHSATGRVSLGYRDNILLGAFAREGSSFAQAEIESFFWRPSERGWETMAFLNGALLRYFSPAGDADGEDQWTGHAEVRWTPLSTLKLGLNAQGYHQDMVVDLSESEAVPVIAPVTVRGALATISARWLVNDRLALETTFRGHESDYRQYAGDYFEAREGIRAEWKGPGNVTVAAAWHEYQRRYHSRPEFTSGGRALEGTRLRLDRSEGELKIGLLVERAGKWTGSASVARLTNRDGSSGYFDYNENRCRAELHWSAEPWSASLECTAKRLDYIVQRVGIGIDPPSRLADQYQAGFRVERELDDAWTVFTATEWERTRSNEPGFNYRVTTVSAGVARTF